MNELLCGIKEAGIFRGVDDNGVCVSWKHQGRVEGKSGRLYRRDTGGFGKNGGGRGQCAKDDRSDGAGSGTEQMVSFRLRVSLRLEGLRVLLCFDGFLLPVLSPQRKAGMIDDVRIGLTVSSRQSIIYKTENI